MCMIQHESISRARTATLVKFPDISFVSAYFTSGSICRLSMLIVHVLSGCSLLPSTAYMPAGQPYASRTAVRRLYKCWAQKSERRLPRLRPGSHARRGVQPRAAVQPRPLQQWPDVGLFVCKGMPECANSEGVARPAAAVPWA